MKTPRKVVVSKRVSEDEKLNSLRWSAFITASGLPYEELSEEWFDFFSAQAEVESASEQLVILIDKAIAQDGEK